MIKVANQLRYIYYCIYMLMLREAICMLIPSQ